MIETVAIWQAFQRQAHACDDMGSPFTATLCRLTSERLDIKTPIGAFINDWPEDRAVADALALRFAGTLHALKRQGYQPLCDTYPTKTVSKNALWEAIESACHEEMVFIKERMQSAPQTNEVRRSATLFAACATIATQFPDKPLVLSEIGASAGLNMIWDHYSYRLAGKIYHPTTPAPFVIEPEWDGPLPPEAPVSIVERHGCDLNPLDVSNPDHCERLMSYIWADQDDRLKRTEKALKQARDAHLVVDKADAINWLKVRLSAQKPAQVHVIYHTVAWQYLPLAAQHEGETLIARAGTKATTDAPLCYLRLEADGARPGAALSLTIWPGGHEQKLGRADFHGRWIEWAGFSSK